MDGFGVQDTMLRESTAPGFGLENLLTEVLGCVEGLNFQEFAGFSARGIRIQG